MGKFFEKIKQYNETYLDANMGTAGGNMTGSVTPKHQSSSINKKPPVGNPASKAGTSDLYQTMLTRLGAEQDDTFEADFDDLLINQLKLDPKILGQRFSALAKRYGQV